MRWLRRRWAMLAIALSVIGPGIITASVDNDANGIATYATAGAQFGHALLWTIPVAMVALIVIQEMAARMGAVTGLGLADLIREQFGVRLTAAMMSVLFLANLSNIVGNFAGVAGSLDIFRVPRLLGVPLVGIGVAVLVVRGGYRVVERIFLAASALYILYAVSAALTHPSWSTVARAAVIPSWRSQPDFLYLAIALIGTTIAPWMQFYHQAAVVDKGLTTADLRVTRVDVVLGVLMTVLVAGSIIVATAATLFTNGIAVTRAEDAARALRPLAGIYASGLFAVGLLNAAIFSVAIIPLSTSYAVCEAFGWEAGLDRSLRQAPIFYGLVFVLLTAGAIVVLWPGLPLVPIMVASQALNGILLPLVLYVMLRLVNDHRLMGAYTNRLASNLVAWATVGLLIALSAMLVILSL